MRIADYRQLKVFPFGQAECFGGIKSRQGSLELGRAFAPTTISPRENTMKNQLLRLLACLCFLAIGDIAGAATLNVTTTVDEADEGPTSGGASPRANDVSKDTGPAGTRPEGE
jgi:hypothetical protein